MQALLRIALRDELGQAVLSATHEHAFLEFNAPLAGASPLCGVVVSNGRS